MALNLWYLQRDEVARLAALLYIGAAWKNNRVI